MADNSVSDGTRDKIALLYPGIRPLAYRILQDVLITTKRKMNIVQSLRSFEEQQAIYSKGRTLTNGVWQVTDLKQIVTNARPGLSWHSYGLAFDTAWAGVDPYLGKETQELRAQLWKQYGLIGQSYGMRWGGGFHLVNGVNDLPHFEMAYGLSINQALELYDNGGLKSVWSFLDTHRGVPVGQDWNLG